MPGRDPLGCAFLAGDVLGIGLHDMGPGQHGGDIVERGETRRSGDGQDQGIVLGMGVGIGDEDVEDHLVEQSQGISRTDMSPRAQEAGEVEPGPRAAFVFPARREAVRLREILLMKALHLALSPQPAVVAQDGDRRAAGGPQDCRLGRRDADHCGQPEAPDLVLGQAGQVRIVGLHDQGRGGAIQGHGQDIAWFRQTQDRMALRVQHREGGFLLTAGQRLANALLSRQKGASTEILEMALQRLGRVVQAVKVGQRPPGPAGAIRRRAEGQGPRRIPADLFQQGQHICLVDPEGAGQDAELLLFRQEVREPGRDDLGGIGRGAQGHRDRERKGPVGQTPALGVAQRERRVSGDLDICHMESVKPDRDFPHHRKPFRS